MAIHLGIKELVEITEGGESDNFANEISCQDGYYWITNNDTEFEDYPAIMNEFVSILTTSRHHCWTDSTTSNLNNSIAINSVSCKPVISKVPFNLTTWFCLIDSNIIQIYNNNDSSFDMPKSGVKWSVVNWSFENTKVCVDIYIPAFHTLVCILYTLL